MSRSRSRTISRSSSPVKRGDSPPVELENTCPFLIRLFVTKGKHTPLIEFDERRLPIRDEFQVYGWKHSTPTSIIQLLIPSFPPPYRSPLARFSFRHIYVDASPRGLYKSKELVSFTGRDLMASVSGESTSTKLGGNAMDMELDDDPRPTHGRKVEEKTLDGYGFVIGDLISVSIHVPEPRAAQSRSGAPGMPPQERGSGGFGWQRDRESGNGPREREAPPSEREGHWARGEALPPQNSFRGENAFRGGRGGFGRVEPAGGRAGGIGIRGAGRRSPERERDGLGGRRSRSPEGRERRESWSRR